jgi:hypothetical protein
MADNEVLVGVEISHRTHMIQVTTMMRGKGRHNSYPDLSRAPEAMRGEALVLIREALRRAGYASMAELDAALDAALVMPVAEEDAAAPAPEPPAPKDKAKPKAQE